MVIIMDEKKANKGGGTYAEIMSGVCIFEDLMRNEQV